MNRLLPTNYRRLPYFAAGHAFPEPVSVEQAFASLRWTVEQRELAWIDPDTGEAVPYADGSMLVRTDTRTAFSPVGNRYTIINNGDIEEMLDGAGFKVEAVGAIDEGARCFAVLNVGPYSSFNVNGDPWNAFLIARWNHDGSGAVRYGLQFWRRVCTNGQQRIAGHKWQTIRHTSGSKLQLQLASELIPQLGSTVEAFVARSVNLTRSNNLTVGKILDELWPKPTQTGSLDGYIKSLNAWEEKRLNFAKTLHSETVADWAGTDYGLVQAVNEIEQWTKTRRMNGDTLARSQILRFDSTRFPMTEKVLAMAGA